MRTKSSSCRSCPLCRAAHLHLNPQSMNRPHTLLLPQFTSHLLTPLLQFISLPLLPHTLLLQFISLLHLPLTLLLQFTSLLHLPHTLLLQFTSPLHLPHTLLLQFTSLRHHLHTLHLRSISLPPLEVTRTLKVPRIQLSEQNCLMNNEVSRMDRGFVHKNLMIDSSEQVVYFFRDLRYQFVSRKFFSDD
uniref:Uncharacterized protein n=1 Tax=Physcomitrium patens TaxID=3218 RepID=A0A2K1J703_PHYPA|nr:hypothetical protein PHYPA_020407 [Physcomitrium patens]